VHLPSSCPILPTFGFDASTSCNSQLIVIGSHHHDTYTLHLGLTTSSIVVIWDLMESEQRVQYFKGVGKNISDRDMSILANDTWKVIGVMKIDGI